MFTAKNTSGLSLEEKVQLLMDERDIRDVIYRDCRSKNRCDVALMLSCFHDDAVDHHQPWFDGLIADMAIHFEQSTRSLGEMVQYSALQILVEVDGDVARAESQVLSAKTFHERAENGDKIMRLSGIRYLDRFECRSGEWRIAERWFIGEWGFFEQAPPLTEPIGIYPQGTEPGKLLGTLQAIAPKRDTTDLSYSF